MLGNFNWGGWLRYSDYLGWIEGFIFANKVKVVKFNLIAILKLLLDVLVMLEMLFCIQI